MSYNRQSETSESQSFAGMSTSINAYFVMQQYLKIRHRELIE